MREHTGLKLRSLLEDERLDRVFKAWHQAWAHAPHPGNYGPERELANTLADELTRLHPDNIEAIRVLLHKLGVKSQQHNDVEVVGTYGDLEIGAPSLEFLGRYSKWRVGLSGSRFGGPMLIFGQPPFSNSHIWTQQNLGSFIAHIYPWRTIDVGPGNIDESVNTPWDGQVVKAISQQIAAANFTTEAEFRRSLMSHVLGRFRFHGPYAGDTRHEMHDIDAADNTWTYLQEISVDSKVIDSTPRNQFFTVTFVRLLHPRHGQPDRVVGWRIEIACHGGPSNYYFRWVDNPGLTTGAWALTPDRPWNEPPEPSDP